MKSKEGNDYLDTFIRQAIGKEPFLSFSRTGDSPVQWIQLLHALDQQDLPGWPLLTPLKIQMQKCDKCSREFCSPINYRRHIRVHRRSLNIVKESHKSRDLLGAFWDKIPLDEAKKILSLKDVTLEEVPGSSIISSLTSFIRKPGFCALPQVYVKAGSLLLDIIQERPSRLPITSQELFTILDDASERTFLCAGTAESMQKYVFDGEAGKIGLEMKNLVACTSFLVEQKLVKAWIADKDAEALRCQRLLVEEEEAAQKRQAELLEKKRQKKLRQEQKTKDQSYAEKPNSSGTVDTLKGLPSGEPSSLHPLSEGNSYDSEAPTDHAPLLLEPVQLLNNEEVADIEAQCGFSNEHLDSGNSLSVESRKFEGNGHPNLVITRWQVPKSQKGGWIGYNTSSKDARAAPANGSKVWTKKAKIENGEECVINRVHEKAVNQTGQTNCEVMIGSISVRVRNCTTQHNCSVEAVLPKKISLQENSVKPNFVQSGTNRSAVKFWRPVDRHESRGQYADPSGNRESEGDLISGVGGDPNMPGETWLQSSELIVNEYESKEIVQPEGCILSSHAAKAFLAERWKEALSGDHVTLVLSQEPVAALTATASDIPDHSILSRAENRLGDMGPLVSSTTGHAKAELGTKSEKGVKIKYISKQRTVT